MAVKEFRDPPKPAVRDIVEIAGELHDTAEREGRPDGAGVFDDAEAAEAGNFLAIARKDANPDRLPLQSVRAEQLGHSFGIPARTIAAEEHRREAMRPFVQQFMPS